MRALLVALMLVAAPTPAPAGVGDPGIPPAGFASLFLSVDGGRIHFVRGGHGPAIILIHGFPETWAEYRAIMPQLAKRFTVIAVDLPGIGRSTPPTTGYDAAAIASDIHALALVLDVNHAYLIGHDLGGLVAYAYVRQYSDSLRGAMIVDVPVGGLDGSAQAYAGLWHVAFIQAPKDLAEKLVAGRQAAFLGWFLDFGNFSGSERTYYEQAYGPTQLHAAFQIYRAFPQDAQWNEQHSSRDALPMVIAVGRKSPFVKLLPVFIQGFRAKGMTDVRGAIIPDAGHYVVSDNPAAVAALIEHYARLR